jgi:hypothetical protein
MTATNHNTTERDKTTQMAEALIAHLGSGPAASIFVERQLREAEGAALTTWTAISLYLEKLRDRP